MCPLAVLLAPGKQGREEAAWRSLSLVLNLKGSVSKPGQICAFLLNFSQHFLLLLHVSWCLLRTCYGLDVCQALSYVSSHMVPMTTPEGKINIPL